VGSGDVQRKIEQEIAGERASALARVTEALERALAELARFDGAPEHRVRQHLLEEAAERLWFLVVHREALGLTRNDVVYETLRVPAEVRRAMGPRRR
jgi:hypothetical protein